MTPAAPASLTAVVPWLDQVLLLAAGSARFAFAFVLVPVFSPQVMPPTVRNSIIIAFGLLALTIATPFSPEALSAGDWLSLFAREAAAGIVVGFFFATVIWAMGAAGEIIDQMVGATLGQLLDPLGQQQDSITATFLSRFAQVIFVTAGGLMLLVGTILQSFAVLPLKPGSVSIDPDSIFLFEGEVGRFFAWAFLLAMPVLVVLFLIDSSLGLLNRFAQQFNVFQLSLSIKAVAATLILILLVPALAAVVIDDLASRGGVVDAVLRAVIGGEAG